MMPESSLRTDACAIWQAGVEAVKPGPLVEAALTAPHLQDALGRARHILVLGAGKAGAAMSAAVEAALGDCLDKVVGLVNVPNESVVALKKIRLHGARPAGSNHPTPAGVVGAVEMLQLARQAGPDEVALCLISGGGSALLPAPADGLTLADKQEVTRLLHSCGATINEMNAVRKHLSAIKGGRLAQAFAGKSLYSLIISDVIGDPLDVIASGPTAADPTTFAQAWEVLAKYDLIKLAPANVRSHLERGRARQIPETLKTLPEHVHNLVIGNNATALRAAQAQAEQLGYRVLNLGAFVEGETRQVALALAGVVRSIRQDGTPQPPPACILCGGETTVTLGATPGRGGRNQEFVLAALDHLGEFGMREVAILSGGTDGEDGPTDAAGAVADLETLVRAHGLRLRARTYLERHDAYAFFQQTHDLLITGLTQTNVMDLRVLLVK